MPDNPAHGLASGAAAGQSEPYVTSAPATNREAIGWQHWDDGRAVMSQAFGHWIQRVQKLARKVPKARGKAYMRFFAVHLGMRKIHEYDRHRRMTWTTRAPGAEVWTLRDEVEEGWTRRRDKVYEEAIQRVRRRAHEIRRRADQQEVPNVFTTTVMQCA